MRWICGGGKGKRKAVTPDKTWRQEDRRRKLGELQGGGSQQPSANPPVESPPQGAGGRIGEEGRKEGRSGRPGEFHGGGPRQTSASPPMKSPVKKMKPRWRQTGDLRLWIGHNPCREGGDLQGTGQTDGGSETPTGRGPLPKTATGKARTPTRTKVLGKPKKLSLVTNPKTKEPFNWVAWAARRRETKEGTQVRLQPKNHGEPQDTEKDKEKLEFKVDTRIEPTPGVEVPGDPKILGTTETVLQERLRIEDNSD